MPVRDPRVPQLDNPELVAALLSELQIVGQIGLLDFVPAVNPVFIVGSRGLSINVEPVVYQSAEIFDGLTLAPAVNAIIADTGQLPAGDYDLFANIGYSGTATAGSGAQVSLQHRNAANAATLATLLQIAAATSAQVDSLILPGTGYRLATNERLRVQVLSAGISGSATATIGIRRRPTP